MKMPLFCFRTVIIQSRARTADPSKRHAPLQICTPRKLIDSFPLLDTDFVSKAPAIGAPINDAMEENPQDMPSRVPRSERSGHILGKAEPGSVTSPAEKKPVNEVMNKPYCSNREEAYFTPQCTEGDERLFTFDADPAQRQNARDERTCHPCKHVASIMRHISAGESPEE
jgi:hypothetical protein